jgi:hypothetical protein
MKTLRGGGPMIQWLEVELPEVGDEAPGMPDGQRRRKRLTVDLPASLYRRFKAACVGRTMAEEVLALVERRTAELEEGWRRDDKWQALLREREGRGAR